MISQMGGVKNEIGCIGCSELYIDIYLSRGVISGTGGTDETPIIILFQYAI